MVIHHKTDLDLDLANESSAIQHRKKKPKGPPIGEWMCKMWAILQCNIY